MGDGDGVDFGPVVEKFWNVRGSFGGLESWIFDSKISIFEGLMNDRHHSFEVGTGGDLWNHATIGFENVDLGNDNIREKFEIGGVLNRGAG